MGFREIGGWTQLGEGSDLQVDQLAFLVFHSDRYRVRSIQGGLVFVEVSSGTMKC